MDNMDSFFKDSEAVQVDQLTGAYSYETISAYANQLISEKKVFSFALIDVDNFSYLLDAFGHAEANMVLCNIADTIKRITGDKGVLARNENDEFSLILKEFDSYDEIWNICHTILVKVNEIVLPKIGSQSITVTIGLSRYPENADSFEDILACAEKAMYRGKTKGRNCFIIYLPEKHANIVPKNEKQRVVGSLNLHSNIFKFLTSTDDLAGGIQNLINFISSYFAIDHVCIQKGEQLMFEKIHQMSKTKRFLPIPQESIIAGINKVTEVFYMADTKKLLMAKQDDLYNVFEEQSIVASCICQISYRNELYGFLRADMTGSDSDESRLWQYSDMDLLLTAAKTLAMILHYSGKSLDNLA